MDFPDYVPQAVRLALSAYLHGEGGGLVGCLQRDEAELANRRGELSEWLTRVGRLPAGEVPQAFSAKIRDLRLEIAQRSRSIWQLRGDVEAIQRLGFDKRMRDAFPLIVNEWPGDREQRGFVYAAWAARRDYSTYRDELHQAGELASSIEATARELAGLLRKFCGTGLHPPEALFSIAHLLRSTDSLEEGARNLHMWRDDRRHLGLDPSRADEVARLAWQTAPSVAQVLDTLADAARDYRPGHGGEIDAAIGSRKRNARAEYLRGFLHSLKDVHGIGADTPQARRAVAIVASVVLNDPGHEVTCDDVRKARLRLT